MSPQDINELRLTAYHEAGHAVIALSLGRSIQRVSVVARENQLGHVEFKKGSRRPAKDVMEAECLVLLGGLAAEACITGGYRWDAARQDLEYVERLIYRRAASERQARTLFRRLLRKVEYLLDDAATWRAVEAIANEVLEKSTISGRSARHLYDQARRSPPTSA
jgi:hypothetical protein